MKKTIVCLLVLVLVLGNVVFADIFNEGTADEFTIDFVGISGTTNPTSGYGIVNNDYRMGTHEITNGQFAKFDTNKVYYTGDNVPSIVTKWYEAAKFVNYLNTSTNNPVAYNFNGSGDYVVWESGDTGYDSTNPYRNSNAHYFLPSEDEWVKAAYWNGTSLQQYATKAGESLTQGNGANNTGWNYFDGDFATSPVIGSWNVGSGSEELNGTFDMMGNVNEWMESPYFAGDYSGGSTRGYRGGAYYHDDYYIGSSFRSGFYPFDGYGIGLRVASNVPEPCSLVLLSLGGLTLLRRKK